MDRYDIILGKDPPSPVPFIDNKFIWHGVGAFADDPLYGKRVFVEANISDRVWRYDGIVVYVFKAGVEPDLFFESLFNQGTKLSISKENRIVIKKNGAFNPERWGTAIEYAIVPERLVNLEVK
jgi:hypothetical protein